MAWDTRHGGRRYLYRSVREGSTVVRVYLGADGSSGGREAKRWAVEKLAVAEARRALAAKRERLAGLGRLATDDGGVRDAAEGLMVLLGFRRHKRGEWRMFGGTGYLERKLVKLEKEAAERKQRSDEQAAHQKLNFRAPAGDEEAVAVFAAARKGDDAALAKLPRLIESRGWVECIGDIGERATQFLIARAAPDIVMGMALSKKAAAMMRDLAGESPTTLEKLLARRVVNCWLAVHAYEAELALAAAPKTRLTLESMLGKAERRMATAARELAVVRRLGAPAMLARLEAASMDGPRRALGGGGAPD